MTLLHFLCNIIKIVLRGKVANRMEYDMLLQNMIFSHGRGMKSSIPLKALSPRCDYTSYGLWTQPGGRLQMEEKPPLINICSDLNAGLCGVWPQLTLTYSDKTPTRFNGHVTIFSTHRACYLAGHEARLEIGAVTLLTAAYRFAFDAGRRTRPPGAAGVSTPFAPRR